jgi:hypothetical protein
MLLPSGRANTSCSVCRFDRSYLYEKLKLTHHKVTLPPMRDARFVDLTAAILMRNPKLTHHKVAPTSPGHAGRDVASAPSDAAGGTVTCRLIHILNVGLRTISAGGSLGVPATVLVFVFDHLRVARHALIGSGHAGEARRLPIAKIHIALQWQLRNIRNWQTP